MSVKLLVCDDDPGVTEVVSFAASMTWPHCEVRIASTGGEALTLFRRTQLDLVVLDINIPAPDGFQICGQIREVSKVPIIMLTRQSSTADKIKAFDLGTDDYVTKPFDPLELVVRMRALMRRTSDAIDEVTPARAPDVIIGDFSLNMVTHEVRVQGRVVHLTTTEYRLLEEMVRHVGTVLPHDMLVQRVWGTEYAGEEHYLKVFVRRLRRKLGDNSRAPRYIQTEWGVGYRFVPQV